MAMGIKVWDASGNLIVKEDDSLCRLIGYVDTGTSNGSVTNGGFSTGTGYWVASVKTTSANLNYPSVSLSGNTLSWTFANTTTRGSCIVHYGVK